MISPIFISFLVTLLTGVYFIVSMLVRTLIIMFIFVAIIIVTPFIIIKEVIEDIFTARGG